MTTTHSAGTAAPAGAHGGATVAIDGLTMRFGERTVSQDIDLTIGAGEVLSIVGPSGCGKTTLLRAVAGLIPPAEGEVRIDGRTTAGTPDGVAMVFQHFGLFPWKTVEANVAYALRVRGVAKKEALERARELITLVGLSGFEKSYPHQLSGGMLQFELLRIWQDHPVTMLFVTHSIDEAVLFGDRIAVLNGRPSGVAELIDVTLPHPRDRSVLADPDFLAIRERVWSLIMGADARH
ncbi:ABC transporter ATP-binding protein [Streptomyces lushanensis]|uniref:ABC transporter ATP-binding protein n=1 Tax=Streptomyces lushanensis TaxID=1434255 RepID=UPI001B8019A9|nr:ABC transporter ATP-binding protein [Streptomyces lushanensis]